MAETQNLAKIAMRQLETTDRPWLSAKVVVTQPPKIVGDSISLVFVVVVNNIGKSVATHVESLARLHPQPFSDTEGVLRCLLSTSRSR